MITGIFILLSALYLICLSFFYETKSNKAFVLLKVIPLILGTYLLVFALELLGYLALFGINGF